uniref:Uncharacterized protein n=1 Tax=Ailuropoda melanoleuca TaxID=9646 RepID=A0A7N5KDK1_AILME
IRLDDCSLGISHCEDLSSLLSTNRALTELNLTLLNGCCNLKSLQLESCDITHASCKDLSAVLSNKPSLIELCIGDNNVGDAG